VISLASWYVNRENRPHPPAYLDVHNEDSKPLLITVPVNRSLIHEGHEAVRPAPPPPRPPPNRSASISSTGARRGTNISQNYPISRIRSRTKPGASARGPATHRSAPKRVVQRFARRGWGHGRDRPARATYLLVLRRAATSFSRAWGSQAGVAPKPDA